MTEEEFLKNYDSNQFFKPSVTVDSIIFTIRDVETDNYRKLPEKKLQVLLVKRAEHPYMGKWSLPGTFVRKEERFEEAVQRSLKAKTNMQDIYLEQLYSWGDPNRDPRTRIISTSYMGLVDSEKVCIKSGGSTQDANWFTVTLKSLKEKMTENKHGYKKEEEIEIYAKNWEEKHLDRLKQEDKIIVEKRIKEMQDTKIDTIKEQEIPYEILEKTGTTYKFDKGDDKHRR